MWEDQDWAKCLVLESNYMAISSLVGIESGVSIGLRPMFAALVVAENPADNSFFDQLLRCRNLA